MQEDADIRRAARALIENFGLRAAAIAALRADHVAEADADAAASWRGVAEAVRRLQAAGIAAAA